MEFFCYYSSPLGTLLLAERQGELTHLCFRLEELPPGAVEQVTPLLRQATQQLEEYFNGQRKTFQLPLAPRGTPFQQRVWRALQAIPYGTTRSYKDVAAACGCPRGYRAVGMANHANPIAIIIPCHRVINADGGLGGYGGGLDLKIKLLELEQTYH